VRRRAESSEEKGVERLGRRGGSHQGRNKNEGLLSMEWFYKLRLRI